MAFLLLTLLIALCGAGSLFSRNQLRARGNDSPARLEMPRGLMFRACVVDAKEIATQRVALVKEARDLTDKAETEKRDFEPAEQERFNKIMGFTDSAGKRVDGEIDKLQVRIDRLNAVTAQENKLSQVVDPTGLHKLGASTVETPEETPDGKIPLREARALCLQGFMLNGFKDPEKRKDITDRHRQAAAQLGFNMAGDEMPFNLMPTREHANLRQQSRFNWDPNSQRYNALSSLQGVTGGVLQPEGFVYNFERAMLAFGYMLQTSEILRTSNANPMPWPMGTDTANKGRRLNQNAAVDNTDTTTAKPTFSALILYAYKYTSDEILVPYELLRDSAFDLEAILGEMLGERLGRVQQDDWTTGKGGASPKGIAVAATTGVTTAAATKITFDEVINLEHSVDPAYRSDPSVGYMCHDSVINYLRLLKNGVGAYLWQASANAGQPDTLNGRPLSRNQSMQATVTGAPVASTVSLIFGALRYYKIRQVGATRLYRLVERYRDNDQDAFLAFVESDGNLLDAGGHPIKSMVQHS